MAVLIATNKATRHVTGDLVVRFYDLSGNNGDTFQAVTPRIETVIITPTTAISVGATWSGSTITFVTGGAWVARVMVIERTG